MLIDVLHEYLDLTGTRFGCGQGVCRACTVIVDDDDGSAKCAPASPARTGSTARRSAPSKATPNVMRRVHGRRLSPVQQAFLDHYSFQCGLLHAGLRQCRHRAAWNKLAKAPIAKTDGRGHRRRGARARTCAAAPATCATTRRSGPRAAHAGLVIRRTRGEAPAPPPLGWGRWSPLR